MGGTDSDPLRLVVEPGDFGADGSITSVRTAQQPPRYPGFLAAEQVREIAVTSRPVSPVTLAFDGGSHPEDVPVVWRKDPEVGWYPIAVGDAGGTASAERRDFSPHRDCCRFG